jgi:hypothetical protein
LNQAAWSTLANNIVGTGESLQLTDMGAVTNGSPRFYRVQTPP